MIAILKKFIPKRFKRIVRLSMHRGKNYVCPFCHYSSKDLLPLGGDFPVLKEKQVIGAGKRFGSCYSCGATDREKLVYIYLKENTKIFTSGKNRSILHVAPEPMLLKKIFKVGFDQYVCGDLFAEGYKYPERVVQLSVLNISFPDDYFDYIICNHVLEHVPDDRKAMKELFRVLKPQGTAILQVPISANTFETFENFSIEDPKLREMAFGQFDHVRIYGQDYSDRLKSCGFVVSREKVPASHLKFGVCHEEDIFVCSKC